MIVIRRLVDRRRAYTGIFLPGEAPRIFPTTEQEHARILQIFKQDRRHENVENDFSDYALGQDVLPPATPSVRRGEAAGKSQLPAASQIEPDAPKPRRGKSKSSFWLVPAQKK